MTTGEKIKEVRKQQKFSQQALGVLLGVSQAMIAQYENGNRLPKIGTLRRIAEALGVPLYEISDWSQYTTEDFKEDLQNSPDSTKIPIVSGKGNANKKEVAAALRKSAKEKLDSLNHLGISKAYDYINYLVDKPENTEPDK